MRMKMVTESQTLKDTAKEFLAYKKAQKIRERTLKDYHKYIDPFIAQSSNSMDIDVLRREILEYVFDRFYTSSGAANPQGTGLGLFIANQIAKRHNADIRMENKAESGCRITVVFWKYRPGNNTM